jgi:Tol biopolymer transport system component
MCRLLTGFLVAALVWAAPAVATFPGQNGKIFFSSNIAEPHDNLDVFSINPDGSGGRQITGAVWPFMARDEESAAMSPDGRVLALALVYDRPGVSLVVQHIYLTDPDGTHPRGIAVGIDPTWSPGGRKIAYTSVTDEAGYQIAVMNADGTGKRLLTGDADRRNTSPDWSPDGQRIAFTSEAPSGDEVRVDTVHPDGTKRRTLRSGARDPSWSPNAVRVAFAAPTAQGSELWSMKADGTDPVRLTSGSNDRRPVWSPDGTRIAFDSERVSNRTIFTIAADGTDMVQVTHPSPGEFILSLEPFWDPVHG